MKITNKILLAGISTVLLAGCAAKWDVDGVAAQAAQGSAFTQALHTQYSEGAAFERTEHDWTSVAFFVERARLAAAGQAPAPTTPADWGLDGTAGLTAARDKLVAALGTNAPAHAPKSCARAQVNYDHWLEQIQEGHQDDHIAAAKAAFEAGLAGCVEPRAEVVAPQSFVVHFGFDSAALDSEAQAVLRQAAAAFATTGMTAIDVVGHTDTAGASVYNERLSQRRADAVMNALAGLGVPANAMALSALGQTAPVVASGDNVAERRNRRVELTVRP